MLWIDLSKARKGERVGGRYIHRWWKNDRWNYKYADKPLKNHGIAATALERHSILAHPQTKDMGAESAFHYSRNQEMKKRGVTHEAVYPDASGRPAFKVSVTPGVAKPVVVSPVGEGTTTVRESQRKDSLQTLEGWYRRQASTKTVSDAFGRPWFDVRQKGKGSNRLSVRYYEDNPFSRREAGVWDNAPVAGGEEELEAWVNQQHRRQRETRGRRTTPARKFPEDPNRPATANLERGKVLWRSEQVPQKGKVKRLRWIREAVFKSDEDRKKFMGQVMAEHYGLLVTIAAAQLRRYGLGRKGVMQTAMAHMTGVEEEDRNKQVVAVDRTAPAYRAVTRAVDSYDPGKGWRFSNWLGECMWWESLRDIAAAHEKVKAKFREVSTTKEGKDIFETIDLGERTAEQTTIEKDLLADWKVRQEEKIAKFMLDNPDQHDLADEALDKVIDSKSLDEARALIVEMQSKGGSDFTEMISKNDLPQPKPTEKTKDNWKKMLRETDLTSQQRVLLEELAPDGDLPNMRPFDEVAKMLPKKHGDLFPKRPMLSSVIVMFQDAHARLSGHPEFEAMRQKISAVDKAIDLLRGIKSAKMSEALDILSKAKRGERAKRYKYIRREGIPGHYKYWYHDPKGNYVRATNAPAGHSHHEEQMGEPKIHPSEPDPTQNPEFFDSSGRKMNRSVPSHAEWNQDYDPSVPLKMWGARWRGDQNDPESHYEHAYYDSDVRARDELKYNIMNRHFDEQLPKVRGFYKQMMQSEQAPSRALGLMVALLDQAKMRAGKKSHEQKSGNVGLCTLKVKNVDLKGNKATFTYSGKAGVEQQKHIVLDEPARSILEELIKGKGKRKSPNDYLFSVPVKVGDRIIYRDVGYNKLIRNLRTLGVTPKQFRTYHGTEAYAQEFQRQFKSLKGRANPQVLQKIAETSALKAAEVLGHYTGSGKDRKLHAHTALRSYIDPVVIRALYLNALDETQKSHKLMGRIEFQGMPISIENKKGSVRKWYDPHGKEHGQTKMNYDYGYIRRTMGTDGDHVDVYIGPNADAENAYVIHQRKKPDFKKFDEDKVMLGFDSEKDAKAAYLKQYDDPRFFGSMTTIPMEKFKEKVFETPKNPVMLKSFVWFAH